MLFHPYKAVKLFGITIWPQGMIPRHRDRLAQSIGNAVGNELVSQETVFDALFETSFFERKVEDFVGSYTNELLGRVYPSFIEALPSQARAPILDTIAALQYQLAEFITSLLKSEETAKAIENFVNRQLDEFLDRRLNEMVSDASIDEVMRFVQERLVGFVSDEGFEQNVRDFVSGRLDDLASTNATLAQTFTPDTIDFIKQRIDSQVPPIVHHLADIATSQNTRKQMGALIKKEVDEYYEQLSLLKKIFISRERIHREVDDLVNKTLPGKVEDYLRGEAFEQEAQSFLNGTIDSVMARPLNELIGQFDSAQLNQLKSQLTDRLLEIVRSEGLAASIGRYFNDAVDQMQSQTLNEVLDRIDVRSRDQVKSFLNRSLVGLVARDETARTVNAILTSQVERLLIAPIGRLGDHLSENALQKTSTALVNKITSAARERLPHAIAEFDVGGMVRKKVSDYPTEKLEELVLSVAQHHLKTIEIFGAVIGFFIGVGQAIYTLVRFAPGK